MPVETLQSKLDGARFKEALDLAYPLAIESYKLSERRMDVIEKRLQELLAFAVTVTLALIAVSVGKVNIHETPFILAMLSFISGMGIAIWGRLSGGIVSISTEKLYDNYLQLNDSDFKLSIVGHAGTHDTRNIAINARKARCADIAAIFFLLEFALVGYLVVSQPLSGTSPDPQAALHAQVVPAAKQAVR